MAVHTDLYYYRSGIYTQTWGDFEGYHAVQIIGYDDADQYFIGKSSWGADWGESGYFKIAYSEVSSAAMFGCWTIAYEKVIPSSFSTIDNVSRSASAVEGGEESSTGTGGADGQSEGRVGRENSRVKMYVDENNLASAFITL